MLFHYWINFDHSGNYLDRIVWIVNQTHKMWIQYCDHLIMNCDAEVEHLDHNDRFDYYYFDRHLDIVEMVMNLLYSIVVAVMVIV